MSAGNRLRLTSDQWIEPCVDLGWGLGAVADTAINRRLPFAVESRLFISRNLTSKYTTFGDGRRGVRQSKFSIAL